MNEIFEKKLQALSQQTFNHQLSELDDNVLMRLKASRQLALSSAKTNVNTSAKNLENPTKENFDFPGWLSSVSSATAFACVSLIAVSMWLQPDFKQQSITTPLDDVALLSSTDELEFYENLDFYIWLEESNANTLKNENSKDKHDAG